MVPPGLEEEVALPEAVVVVVTVSPYPVDACHLLYQLSEVPELVGGVLVAVVVVGGVAAELPVEAAEEVEPLAEAAAGLEEQSEAAAEPSVEVAAPVEAEEMDVLEVPGVGGWLLPSEEFVAVFVGQWARAVVPPEAEEAEEVEEAELPVGAA